MCASLSAMYLPYANGLTEVISSVLIVGLVVFYICKCLYLYGDLAIYAIGVPKSVATAVW